MLWKYAGCAGLAALFLAPSAFAHHPSGVGSTGGAGPIATISASTLEQGHSAAAIFFEMVKINPFSDDELGRSRASTSTPTASTPSWRRRWSMPTA